MNLRIPIGLMEQASQVATNQGMSLAAFTRQSMMRNIRLYLEHENAFLKMSSEKC
jgi:predicted HicB family RNase H-like nuclease